MIDVVFMFPVVGGKVRKYVCGSHGMFHNMCNIVSVHTANSLCRVSVLVLEIVSKSAKFLFC